MESYHLKETHNCCNFVNGEHRTPNCNPQSDHTIYLQTYSYVQANANLFMKKNEEKHQQKICYNYNIIIVHKILKWP